MLQKKIILYIFLIFIGIIIFLKKNKIDNFYSPENLNKKKKISNYNLLRSRNFEIYNQNYNAEWKNKVESTKYPIVYSYPTSYIDLNNTNKYVFNDFTNIDLKNISKLISSNFGINEIKNLKKNLKPLYSEYDLNVINKKTEKNRVNWNPNFNINTKYIESNIPEVNYINYYFLEKINYQFYKYLNKYKKKNIIFYPPLFIVNYKLKNIMINNNIKIYEIITNITRSETYLISTFFIQSVFKKINNKYLFYKIKVDYIGNNTQDKYLLRNGLNNDNKLTNINPIYNSNNSIFNDNINKIYLDKKKNLDKENNLDFSYSCFTFDKDSDNPYSRNIFAINKNDCQNKFNIIGIEKPNGIWDSPCINDNECSFYKENKNYTNEYGKCINNKCQLPINMRNLGYHYYINHKNTKPLCYNCNPNQEWQPYSSLDFCCDEQKDRKKYKYLKSPDYAFLNDNQNRLNEWIKKTCKRKGIYNNIFDKPKNYEYKCGGNIKWI